MLHGQLIFLMSINCLILAPSISFCFFYVPLLYITLTSIYFGTDGYYQRLVTSTLVVVISFILWLIYQKRELKRFLEKQEAEIKELKAIEKKH